jgi:hypothetical protein
VTVNLGFGFLGGLPAIVVYRHNIAKKEGSSRFYVRDASLHMRLSFDERHLLLLLGKYLGTYLVTLSSHPSVPSGRGLAACALGSSQARD